MRNLLGVDLGGTKTTIVLATEAMSILARRRFATQEAGTAQAVLDRIATCVCELLEETGCPRADISGCGISAGGPLDPASGTILSPPNLPGWDRIPMTDILSKALRIPCFLENDANACALAEWRLGAGRGSSTMVFLTFGTGMGAGLILGGRLHRGADCLAGEVGHIRMTRSGPEAYGKRGSFEGYCSGAGIAKMAQAEAKRALAAGKPVAFCHGPQGLGLVTAKGVADAAASGDELALSILAKSGRQLGYALAAMIDLLNPDTIVIGSIFARCRDFLYPEAARVIALEALPAAAKRCRIEPAALGEELGNFAALIVAAEGLHSIS